MRKEQKLLALLFYKEHELKVKHLNEKLNHLYTQRDLKELKGDLKGVMALELKIKAVSKELEQLEQDGFLLFHFVKLFLFEEMPDLMKEAREETEKLFQEWLDS
jgi:sensor histidine kinase YesM